MLSKGGEVLIFLIIPTLICTCTQISYSPSEFLIKAFFVIALDKGALPNKTNDVLVSENGEFFENKTSFVLTKVKPFLLKKRLRERFIYMKKNIIEVTGRVIINIMMIDSIIDKSAVNLNKPF